MRTKRKTPRAVSIQDVARLSGVSISTVSRVVNKFPSVNEKNRKKVTRAIKELKYQPSVVAQRLASGKSNVIALVIPRYEGIFYSFYALEIIRGIGTLCEALKLDLLLHLIDANTPLNLKGVGGIIFADIIGNRGQLQDALNQGTPVVVINNLIDDLDVSSVTVDNKSGAAQAVEYLIGLGHRKIAHISGDLATQAAQGRLEGYEQALTKRSIPLRKEYVVKTDYSRGQARMSAEKLLGLDDPPTAVFVASDSMALEVMTVMREAGRSIPRDLSIIGFDDNPSGLYGPVALTTVKQPLIRMAQRGVEELRLIMLDSQNRQVKKILLPTELVIRESCSPLKK